MAQGTSHVEGVLDSDDVASSIRVVRALGAHVDLHTQPDGSLAGEISGWGSTGPVQPNAALFCKNSGTTARLLMGILAPWNIAATISGDMSLSQRPMGRVVDPLTTMGVHFKGYDDATLPLIEEGSAHLRAISYHAPVASAQVKSALLLAGTRAQGTTSITEPYLSRNHTELMLPEYGVPIQAEHTKVQVTGPMPLHACTMHVPGDPSSAAYFVCAATLLPKSDITIEHVDLNPTRIGFLQTLAHMGAHVSWSEYGSIGKEPFGCIHACYGGELHGCEVASAEVPSQIDEIPILALVAAHAKGMTVFHGIHELRVKETDRAQAIVDGLGTMGIRCWIDDNDLYIKGDPDATEPAHVCLNTHGDHRLAMTWAIAALLSQGSFSIQHFDAVKVSFPHFMQVLEALKR